MHIALIAHDEKKDLMVGFATAYKHLLEPHQLYATGTTGLRIIEATGLTVHRFNQARLVAINKLVRGFQKIKWT